MLKNIFISLRPRQWVKNLFLFAGIIFSQQLINLPLLFKVVLAFWVFCALTGAVYLINDLVDLEQDRAHPKKKERPLAAGNLRISEAMGGIVGLVSVGLWVAYGLGLTFFALCLLYLTLQVAYSFWLKQIVIIDVFCIAAGFLLRVVAGAAVISIVISPWLLICTTLLALFIGFSKRRHEIVILEGVASGQREVLKDYSADYLDQMIAVVSCATVLSYLFYTQAAETVGKFGTHRLIFTTPFIFYGIFRYLYLVHKKELGGSPEEMLLTDWPLLVDVVLWGLAVLAIIHWR